MWGGGGTNTASDTATAPVGWYSAPISWGGKACRPGKAACGGSATSHPVNANGTGQPAIITGVRSGPGVLAGGDSFYCAVTLNGTTSCWGLGTSGQLGTGALSTVREPVAASGLPSAPVQVEAAGSAQCVLLADGTVWCSGVGSSGQLGNGTFTAVSASFVQVSGITGATRLGASRDAMCALLADRTSVCWGLNDQGQLTGSGNKNTPFPTAGISDAVDVVGGAAHTCFVLGSGEVRCVGRNTAGQLGDGTTTGSSTPVTVEQAAGTALSSVVAIDAWTTTTCAVKGDGTVW